MTFEGANWCQASDDEWFHFAHRVCRSQAWEPFSRVGPSNHWVPSGGPPESTAQMDAVTTVTKNTVRKKFSDDEIHDHSWRANSESDQSAGA